MNAAPFQTIAESDAVVALYGASTTTMIEKILASDPLIINCIKEIQEDPAKGIALASQTIAALSMECPLRHRHPHEMTAVAVLYVLFNGCRSAFQELSDSILSSHSPSFPWSTRYAETAVSGNVRSTYEYEPFSVIRGGMVSEGTYRSLSDETSVDPKKGHVITHG